MAVQNRPDRDNRGLALPFQRISAPSCTFQYIKIVRTSPMVRTSRPLASPAEGHLRPKPTEGVAGPHGPYAILLLKALKLAIPLAGPLADMTLTSQQLQQAQHHLDLMTALVAEFPDQADSQLTATGAGDLGQLISPKSAGQLTPAEGQAALAAPADPRA